ncbi:MAG: hypothetical protein RBS39_13570 [Phycisphaerales bacterium]|jgi:hypothetical protein|nr:hypothetical protein [Phycisphaerales bacterium]
MNDEGGLLPATAPTPVANSIHCVSCGYALDGLAPDGICPECATPIARSMQGFLKGGDPRWVATLHVGARLSQIGMIGALITLMTWLCFALFAVYSFLSGTSSDISAGMLTTSICVSIIPAFAAVTLIPLGCWLITTPLSASMAEGLRDRALFRWSTLTIAAIGVGTFVLPAMGLFPRWVGRLNLDVALWLVAGVLVLISLSAQGSYIADLARLIPDRKIHRRARLLRWLAPVLAMLTVLSVFAGPLIFAAWPGPFIACVLFALLYSRLARVLYDCKEAAWLNSRSPRPRDPVI